MTDDILATDRRALLGALAAVPVLGGVWSGQASAAPVNQPRRFFITADGGRQVEITEWVPRGRPVGIILFSHGAGSAPKYYDPIILPLVQAGWRVLGPLHVDSREHPDTKKFPGLTTWKARVEDFRALQDHIGHAPYVAMGHSYGGMTALVLGGAEAQRPEGLTGPFTDGKALAVVAFSPPAAIPVLITREGYGKIAVPALVQTGTTDIVPGITGATPDAWRSHLDGYDAAPPGGHRYGLVLEGVNHYFGGMICDFTQPGPPVPARMADANRITHLFLKAYGHKLRSAAALRARVALDAAVSDALPVRLMTK
ncbi:alpha/beta fold hydrolase [Novosphingobium sp. FSY-8]|uniref:Alpha/beta fold hydrolase n=1 Tax=Novosphingobium ovatum TaxID=1908523 RepID=A0ABW9X910_9SPHN|nr:alpha/beta fold hydrolase [Novosphingobium ovatum]NBC35008.1 alpha/beta fold hydrolase [Novosphingobium ovatum]